MRNSRRAIITLASTLLMAALTSEAALAATKPESLLKEAAKLTDQGDYQNASKLFEKVTIRKPNDARAFNGLSVCLIKMGQFDKAHNALKKAKSLDPEYAFAREEGGGPQWYYRNLADIYEGKGKLKECFDSWQKAIAANPKDPEGYYNYGVNLSQHGKKKKALAEYSKAIKLNSKNSLYLYNRGSVYMKLKDYNNAVMDLSKSIKLDPDFYRARINRGKCYRQLNMIDKAIKDYNHAIKIKPQNFTAYRNRGNCWFAQGEFKKALKDYDSAIAKKPDYAGALQSRGNTYQKLGDLAKAEADWKKARRLGYKKQTEQTEQTGS